MRTTAAETAKAIRIELKAKFPTTKFKVTSKTYSMGNNVNVSWFDGVKDSDVEEIVKKYQEGHFDGMIDMYEYSNSRNDIPQVKYTFCNRHYSQAVMESVVHEVCKEWGVEPLPVKVENYDDHAYLDYQYDQINETIRRKVYSRLKEGNF